LLRRIFGQTGDEIIESQRKLCNGELHNFHSSPCIIRMIESSRMRWAGHVASKGVEELIQGFVGKTYRKIPQGGPRRRWEDNIREAG
jgi:hypothetical protein